MLQTFIDIFKGDVKRIIIPNIQRDYAQGRDSIEISRIRNRFLNALYDAVINDKKIKLDFVYGDLDSDGTLTLLDGQQRLTTLFLLHWYAAKKENIPMVEIEFLKNFSYDTRHDSKAFCKFLIDSEISISDEKLSDAIEDLSDFPLGWKKDPTVSSMLVMLDAIDEKFCDVENLWDKLNDGIISFYFLSIKDMGLTDELYVTMNSRGKPLTDFEHFKAEFKRQLDEINSELSNKIILKIDTVWTDLLWTYRDENNLIDDSFLAYFGFLCDIILYRKGSTPQGKSRDPFDLLDEFFNDNAQENIQFMEESFDCWYELSKHEKISDFFYCRVSKGDKNDGKVNKHAPGKIITYFSDVNFFGDCLNSYGKNFALGKTVMLYAFLTYLLNKEKISDTDFRRRIRIVNNLVNNSRDAELSNSETRNNGNRIPAMLEQVDNIIIDGKILQRNEIKTANPYNFNENQLREEQEKIRWTVENPDKAELLFELEDHYLLYGQIGVVGLDYPENFERFISLFKCDYDKINCALLAIGDYYQIDNNGHLYQFGSMKPQSWQNLFHKSSLNKNFDYTKEYLDKLLHGTKNFTNAYLQKIIDDYLETCKRKSEYDWTYYYLKYPEFRPPRYGKYWWENFEDEPYCFSALYVERKRSANSYQPFLKVVDKNDNISREDLGLCIILGNFYVECENNSYVVRNLDTHAERNRLKINQRDGIDKEDRIKKFMAWAENYLYR